MQTLRLFCDVAVHHSFSQAAARHGITQSAASQRIGQLEKRLGVKLIDRSVRPLALTPSGEVYLRGCRELLDRYDGLEQQVTELGAESNNGNGAGEVRGEVRVDAIYSAGIDLLSHMKEAFESRWPRAKVVLEYKRPEGVHDAVKNRECDLGIVSYPRKWADVHTIDLRDERMAVVCSVTHPLANRKCIDATELGEFELVSFETDLPVGKRIKRYLKDQGVAKAITTVFDNIDTIKSAVAVTNQVAILPLPTVKREVERGTLAAIELGPELTRPVGVIYRKSRSNGSLTDAARAFVDQLKERESEQETR